MLRKPRLIITIAALCLCACSKDEPEPTNPTNGKSTAVFNTAVPYGTMTDQDGNVYKKVTIGTQTWMAENLRTSTYYDGTAIPNVISDSVWRELTTGASCTYNNSTNTDTIATYGRIYNWYAVNTGKLAPQGWHVPTDADWAILAEYLGGYKSAGGPLKETGISHWNDPNLSATNETGFTALPGGIRTRYHVNFFEIGNNGCWWSTTEDKSDSAWHGALFSDNGALHRGTSLKEQGNSVRCVKY